MELHRCRSESVKPSTTWLGIEDDVNCNDWFLAARLSCGLADMLRTDNDVVSPEQIVPHRGMIMHQTH